MPSHASEDEAIDPELIHLHNIVVLLIAVTINVWWLNIIAGVATIWFVWMLRESD